MHQFSVSPKPLQNRLLASLPPAVLQRLLPDLEAIHMPGRQVLFEVGRPVTHVYFPTTAIISLLVETDDGGSAAAAVVGNNGVVGISLFMGGELTSSRAVVQNAGDGFRLKAQVIKDEFYRAGSAMQVILRYTQALITEMSQKAVCSRRHSLSQQLCRCLLISLDRTPGNEVAMTHEQIANVIGVRREGVSQGAMELQREGVISYSRGRICVHDRQGLEERSCSCYASLKHECHRLLPEALAA